jgi:L-ascorbate metabolism protein UlaG (beta-lactamase superfamily)
MLGVSTIGNAILIAYDDNPILATDPWFGDENPAYFGIWGLSHRIPPDCKADILNAKYIWFSHGHPDHLNTGSLEQLHGKHILLGDHVGGRIAADLRKQGFQIAILPDRQWVELSPNIRVFCSTTVIQDRQADFCQPQ